MTGIAVPAKAQSESNTKTRLLDAAEELFAEFGFNGVSVRQIVDRAKVNLGAIPYYFGTKENLFKEVILRRAVPMRKEREKLIDAVMKKGKTPVLEDVLWALLEPAFRVSHHNAAFRRLLGRASMDPTPEVRRLLAEIYNTDFMIVPSTIRKACPELPEKEFYWRLNCLYGVMLFVQADTGKIQTIAGEDFDTSEPDVALKYVIPFLAAGLRAP